MKIVVAQFSLFTEKDVSRATFSKDKWYFGFVLFVPSNTRLVCIDSMQANKVLSQGINVTTKPE